MEWYKDAFIRFTDFQGRSQREAFWFFLLFHLLVAFALGFVDGLLGLGGFLGFIYALIALVPSAALTVRRLHDMGRSGWFILLALLPGIGMVILLIMAAIDSEDGSNEWGPNPKHSGPAGINAA